MLKKSTILINFLSLFLSINASATNYEYAGVFSEHRAYSAAFGGANWYIMQAAVLLNDYNYDPSNPVTLKIGYGSSVDVYELSYYGDQFLTRDLFVHAFPPWESPWGAAYPHPSDSIWPSSSYEFSVNDSDGNPVTANWTIPYTRQLDIPYISATDPTNHFFDWNDVAGADAYQLQIAPLDSFGNPMPQLAYYTSGDLSDSEFTVGHLSPGEYAIWIQAREEHPDYSWKFLNRSSYFYYYHVPVPDPSTKIYRKAVYSEHVGYDTNYFSLSETTSIMGFIVLTDLVADPLSISATLEWDATEQALPFAHTTGVDSALYIATLGNVSPTSFSNWENKTYTFKNNGNEVGDVFIPPGTYRELSLPVATYDDNTKTVSWQNVEFADEYVVRILRSTNVDDWLSHAGRLGPEVTHYSFDPSYYDILENGAIIAVEARGWDPPFVFLANNSIYVTRSAPSPVKAMPWIPLLLLSD